MVSKPQALNQQSVFFIRPTASYHDFTTSTVKSRYENEKHSGLDSWMCTEHSMLTRNSNMELIQTLIPNPTWSTTEECVQKQIFNDKWLTTSTRIFYKSSSASLDCITISELRSAIDNIVAIVHENFTSQHRIEKLKFGRMQHVKFIAWNKWKIWKLKYYEITAALPPYHTKYYSCSYMVNCIHEYFTATDSHL